MVKALGLKEIAEATGVSLSTVSRALKDDPRISRATRRKVRAAVETLGGSGRTIRQSVGPETAQCVALILPERDGWVGDTEISITVLECLQEACEAYERTVVTGRLRPGMKGLAALGLGGGVRVEGILGYRLHDADAGVMAQAAREAGLPFILLNRVENEPGGISLGVDHEEAGRLAARHLRDLGHRRIGVIFRSADIQSSRLRLAGVREALAETDHPLEKALAATDVAELSDAREAAIRLMERGATALIVDSDRRAIAVMSHLQGRGAVVPRDLSIVGFDGSESASVAEPPLTSVYTPWREMTRLAARLVMECGRDRLLGQGRLLWRPKLVPGGSSARVGETNGPV
jgi:DNA-binding LacI/PurR family transcriptional regulator